MAVVIADAIFWLCQNSQSTDEQGTSSVDDALFQRLKINNPDAEHRGTVLEVSHCMFYKVVAIGFNTLCYDAGAGVLNPRINLRS